MELKEDNGKTCVTTETDTQIVYENVDTESVKVALIEPKEAEAIELDEEYYEPLQIDSKPRHKGTACNLQDDALKRLKSVIYIVSALVCLLYITVVVLAIIFAVTNSRVTDGEWRHWGNWSECTVTCGDGVQTRSRECTNPKPYNGGEYCTGVPLEIKKCCLTRCAPIASAFSVDLPYNQSDFDGTSKVIFARMIYQHGNDFNLTTGTFLCSIPGTYHFSVTLVKQRTSSGGFYCRLYKSVSNIVLTIGDSTDSDGNSKGAAMSQSALVHLVKGDSVFLGNCSADPSLYMEQFSFFTGFLLYPDS